MAKNNHHYFSLHFISSTFFFVSFLFTTELSASTESFQEWYIKGMEERAHGNFLSSENFFKKATENNPKNPAVWHMLGLSQAYNKKYSAALESLKKASYYSPKDIDIKLDIILILAWSQDYDQATEELNNILRQKPYCAEAHFLKGRIYYYRGI